MYNYTANRDRRQLTSAALSVDVNGGMISLDILRRQR